MKLRTRTLAVIAGVTLGLGAIALLGTAIVVLDSAREMERRLAERDVSVAQAALDGDIERLRETGRYWSIWDDAYAFADDHNPRFIDANLYDTVLREARLDAIFFLDEACEPIYTKTLASAEAPAIDVAAAIPTLCAALGRHTAASADPNGQTGIVQLPDGPAVVFGGPILTSERRGPPRGLLVVARRLDQRVIGRLSRSTQLDLSLDTGSLERGGDTMQGPEARITSDGSSPNVEFVALDRERLRATRALRDMTGREVARLAVVVRRDAVSGTLRTMKAATCATLVVWIALCFAVTLFVDRSVLRPLTTTIESVDAIAACGDVKARVPIQGRDEFGRLGEAINTMLHALERAQRELVDRDGQLREMLAALERARGDLEQRVDARTAELTAANAELREAKDAAEAASRLKGEFLANMSHEIRTPLNGLLGMAELLRGTPLDTTQAEFVGMLITSGQALLSVIGDILDVTKLEAGRLQLEAVAFEPRRIVEDVGELFAASAQQKKLELHCCVDPAVPLAVVGDPHRVKQVVSNLVGNAIKFADRGDVVISLALRRIEDERATLQVSVADHGPGIAPDVVSRLFEPFSQADRSTTRRYGGTGLGLAICKQLVDAMGGRIGVDTALGAGTTFWFEIALPLGPAADDTGPESARFAGLRAFVADPSPAGRSSVLAQLAVLGFNARGFSEASAAFAALDAEPRRVDLLVMDSRLEAIGGRSLARLALADSRLRPRCLLRLEPLTAEEDPAGPPTDGVELLGKPVRLERLRSALSDALLAENAPTDPVTGPEPAHAPAGGSPTAASPAFRGIRILVVEDNPVNQQVVLRMLERAGYACDLAENGIAALDAFERNTYAVVLMDCQMPAMDGYTATREIRAREAANHRLRVPVLAMTANALAEDRARCLAAGMDDYLTKPVSAATLLDAVARWSARAVAARAAEPAART